MKLLFLPIVMALLLPQFGQAKFAEEELFKKWGKPFIEESLGMIHTDLASAVFYSNYYEACLTDKDSWFDKEKVIYPNNPYFEQKRRGSGFINFFSKEFCTLHLSKIRNDIKEKYSLMRAYMIIAMGDSPGYVSLQEFYGLTNLPDFSEDEKRLAEQIFNKNVSANKALLETGELPENLQNDSQLVCAYLTEVNESQIRGCFHRRYLKLIVGNEETKSPGLPLLAFVTSENPSNDELIEGIRKIRRNSSELLDEFKRKYGATMDEKGHTTFKNPLDDLSNSALLDEFLISLPRLRRTGYNGYPKLAEAGATYGEIQRLLSSVEDYLSEEEESSVCMEDYYELVDKTIKYALYRPDGSRSFYVPFEVLAFSVSQIFPMTRNTDDMIMNLFDKSCPKQTTEL